jgi:hypothetical protein
MNMKIIKSLILVLLVSFAACDVDYFDSPNEPESPTSPSVFNNAMNQTMNDFRDVWFSGRFTLATMQYWQQSEYGDEDRYGYRESMRETWEDFYYNLENFRQVILLNEDEDTKVTMSAYGDNEAQIACARIMMAYTFNIMADTWGDIPYYSYSTENADFQALNLGGVSPENEILAPKYATQEDIYVDILKQLDEAAETLSSVSQGFTQGDMVFYGDVDGWRKFANSLRLRIALKIRAVNQSVADTHIADATADGVISSNAENAAYQWDGSDKNSSPMYYSWNVDKRSDFAVSNTFITMLKGENLKDHALNDISSNPFLGIMDPRIHIYAQPNSAGDYIGMPIAESSAEAATFKFESLPGTAIIDVPDFRSMLMEYAEVEFILSELNGWDQTHYENGVRASMERWGVPAADIDTYIAALPAASEETVLTQKYIALYMDGHTAFAEYRRTGYPEDILMPGDDYSVVVPGEGQFDYTFNAIPSEITNDLPTRMEYPSQESTLNQDNYLEAVSRLTNGNDLTSKLWWDVN